MSANQQWQSNWFVINLLDLLFWFWFPYFKENLSSVPKQCMWCLNLLIFILKSEHFIDLIRDYFFIDNNNHHISISQLLYFAIRTCLSSEFHFTFCFLSVWFALRRVLLLSPLYRDIITRRAVAHRAAFVQCN